MAHNQFMVKKIKNIKNKFDYCVYFSILSFRNFMYLLIYADDILIV